jgi:cytochrome c553
LRPKGFIGVNAQRPTPNPQAIGGTGAVGGNRKWGVGSWTRGRTVRALMIAGVCVALAGCRQDMHDAPRYDPLERSTFFRDGQASRMAVANTVARGQLREDEHLYTGRVGGQLATEFPMPITMEVMQRGRERFTVFCSPCHGATGVGNGMIVQRGFRQPPSYHEERLVNAPPGYLFDVMTNGFGAMQDYAAQVPVADRWAIAAYIRALQLSRRGTVDDVPAERRGELDQPAAAGAAEPAPAGAAGQPAAAAPAQTAPAAQENE